MCLLALMLMTCTHAGVRHVPCRELVPTTDIGLAVSLMNLLWSQLDAWWSADTFSSLHVELANPAACLDGLFVFSLVWSLGATCDRASVAAFGAFLRSLLTGSVTAGAERRDVDLGPGLVIAYPEQLLHAPLPEVCDAECATAPSGGRGLHVLEQLMPLLPPPIDACWLAVPMVCHGGLPDTPVRTHMQVGRLLHDFTFDAASCSWRPWIDSIQPHVIPDITPCTEIVVPTLDTVRASALLQLLVSHRQHALLVGPTGTAKTLCIRSTLEQLAAGAGNSASKGRSGSSSTACYHIIATAFSAQTSANQVCVWIMAGKAWAGSSREPCSTARQLLPLPPPSPNTRTMTCTRHHPPPTRPRTHASIPTPDPRRHRCQAGQAAPWRVRPPAWLVSDCVCGRPQHASGGGVWRAAAAGVAAAVCRPRWLV